MNSFRGIFPAAITPMTPGGRFCEERFRQVLEFNIRAGAHGFWLAGGSGESILLDDEENLRIGAIAAEQARGRAANIMHVGAPTTARAARLAEGAARAGADAICCVPPFFYHRSDEEIAAHYRVVAAAADLPLFVYNLPGCTGVEITVDLMKSIQQQVPQLAGLKHSSPHFASIREFARLGLLCFVGNSALMLPALSIGAAGCIDGPPGIAPEPWVKIWNACQEGDLRKAQQAQEEAMRIVGLARIFGGSSYHAVLKAAIGERLGRDCGAPRPPALPLSAAQRARVVRGLAALELPAIAASDQAP